MAILSQENQIRRTNTCTLATCIHVLSMFRAVSFSWFHDFIHFNYSSEYYTVNSSNILCFINRTVWLTSRSSHVFLCSARRSKVRYTIEPPPDKTNKWHVRPAKPQISLGIRPVCSVSSLSAWRKLGSLASHWAQSEDSDQTGRMLRLIWVFARRTCHFFGFIRRRLNYENQTRLK